MPSTFASSDLTECPKHKGKNIHHKTAISIILEELLGKPICQMIGEELLFLDRLGAQPCNSTTEASISKEERLYVYGLAGIARLFDAVFLLPIVSSRVVKSTVPLHKWSARLLWMQTLLSSWLVVKQEDEDEYNRL